MDWRLEHTAESHSLLSRLSRAWPLTVVVALADHGCSQYTNIAANDYSRFVSFPMTNGHFSIDFCDVIWNALYEYLASFWGSINARTGRGYRLYGPRMGPLTILVWWRGRHSDNSQQKRQYRWTCCGVMVPRTLDYPITNLIRAKVHRLIILPACPRRTDRQTDKHPGNSATIRSNEGIGR